jgi:hypothetical protein
MRLWTYTSSNRKIKNRTLVEVYQPVERIGRFKKAALIEQVRQVYVQEVGPSHGMRNELSAS